MLEKVESDNMENVKQEFLQSQLQSDHQSFLEDIEIRLINKT